MTTKQKKPKGFMFNEALGMLGNYVQANPEDNAALFNHTEPLPKWTRFVVAGCIHATRACPAAVAGLVAFIRERKPDVVCLNGDLYDLEAYMGSKHGHGEPVEDDVDAGLHILRIVIEACREVGAKLVFLEGNHEARLSNMANHADERVAYGAAQLLHKLKDAVEAYERGIYVPYSGIFQGYRICGVVLITHGTIFNQSATRDMAEMYAKAGVRYVYFNHTHGIGLSVGRRDDAPIGINCGNLLRTILMGYSHNRRQTFSWAQGFGFGVTDGDVCYPGVYVHPKSLEGETWTTPNWPV